MSNMKKIPACRSMNFAVYDGMLNRFKDTDDLIASYQKGGLNGLEIIYDEEDCEQHLIRPDMINGIHLFFHLFWMDFWKRNFDYLDSVFDSREQWIEFYHGFEKEAYLDCFRKDLKRAEELGAKYVVFHVSEVRIENAYYERYQYTNEEVIDAALEVINTLLDEHSYPFDFLVENLGWSGLTLREPALTKKLLEGMHTDRKGIMLDTGHYMNTNHDLETPEMAVDYLNAMIDAHEAAGVPILDYIKGMHLQMSLGGQYIKDFRKKLETEPVDLMAMPFYNRFGTVYGYGARLDQHRPWIGQGVKEFVERVDPDYLTMEFSMPTREGYEESIEAQGKLLGYV